MLDICFVLLTLMDDHYADHRQSSRVRHGSVNSSHAPEIFSSPCHPTFAATWLMSTLVISAAKLVISAAKH
jgi:hypothetical protein